MKQILLLLVVLSSACATLYGCNNPKAEQHQAAVNDKDRLEISFDFNRGGIASSQYAIWIEDETGRLVRTVYATSFTVRGGYEYREDAIPVWVSKAKPGKMSSGQVDAITGATPQNGRLTYQWDGTDSNGNNVMPGRYRFFVEATLYWKSRVMYSGELTWGGKGQASIPMKARYFNWNTTNADMITDLKARYIRK